MILSSKKNTVIRILFFAYLLFLCWAILWKFGMPHIGDGSERVINLIPFTYNTMPEMRFNLLVFIPFGLYISALTRKSFAIAARNALIILLSSFSLEALQYIMAIGRSDMADLILNTLGGVCGILLFFITAKLFGRNADTAMLVVCVIITLCELAVSCFVLFRTLMPRAPM